MGHALAKAQSGLPVEPQNGNKKAASMTTKKHETQLPLGAEIEGGASSFSLLSELHGDLQNILELLEKHDVRDFRVEKGDERISLKRGAEPAYNQPMGMQAPMSQQYPGNNSHANGPSRYTEAGATLNFPHTAPMGLAAVPEAAPVVVPNKAYREVTSPMVGTFYRRPAVDAEPYVEVGDMVKKGDVICIIEAMKLMNEIEAEISGKVVEVCLDDAQMVEYGEVLFRVEPV